MKLKLKPALENDINFLLALRKSTMEEYLIKVGIPTDEESHLARIRYKFDSAKIAYLNDKPIGLLKYYDSEDWCEIIQVQIDPDFQNKGYGEALVKIVISEASRIGQPVKLSVLKSNPAFTLYSRLGFTVVSESETEYTMKIEPNKYSQQDAAKSAAPLL